MSDFVQCPQCKLRHTRRADGLCPRCKNAVAPDAAAAAVAASTSPAAPAPVIGQRRISDEGRHGIVTSGSRAAGVILILNALTNAAVMTTTPGLGSPFPSVLVDMLVGFMLLARKEEKWQKWALARAVLGGLIFGGILVAQGEWFAMIFQIALSSSLVLLLLGNPSRPRVASGLVLACSYFVVPGIGLVGVRTGSDPFAAAELIAKGEITSASGLVRAIHGSYCIEVPKGGWYLRADKVAHKDNPAADRWLLRPDIDVSLVVIAEELPGSIEPAAYSTAVARSGEHAPGFRLVRQYDIQRGSVLNYTARASSLDLEYYRAGFADGSTKAFQVLAFGTPPHVEAARGELEDMLRSFRLDCSTQGEAK